MESTSKVVCLGLRIQRRSENVPQQGVEMSFLWVPVTLIAAAAQTARNATQRALTQAIGTLGATQVRFLYGFPFALFFLFALCLLRGVSPPALTQAVIGFTFLAAIAQILATALMLKAMQTASFSVTTAYIKTEPVLTAIAGILILSDIPGPLQALGIIVSVLGVLLLSVGKGAGMAMVAKASPVLLGLVAGSMFGLSAVMFRAAILALPDGDFILRATTILALGLGLQAMLLGAYLVLRDRRALTGSLAVWRSSLTAGFLGALASQFWFLGFALTSAANVRTLALVEVLFAQLLSFRLFREKTSTREMIGMAVLILGVALLLWGARPAV
jgi:drug/metabolite transporter (DMT)-like permease